MSIVDVAQLLLPLLLPHLPSTLARGAGLTGYAELEKNPHRTLSERLWLAFDTLLLLPWLPSALPPDDLHAAGAE